MQVAFGSSVLTHKKEQQIKIAGEFKPTVDCLCAIRRGFVAVYASRCNNFHGNVAARMNSINANKDTFKMYTDMFLAEYIILAIHLNSQGALSDVVLNKVKKNANLMV